MVSPDPSLIIKMLISSKHFRWTIKFHLIDFNELITVQSTRPANDTVRQDWVDGQLYKHFSWVRSIRRQHKLCAEWKAQIIIKQMLKA